MTGSSLVTVVMNCFNGERYLREAIDSVVAQTYANWEIVFWDNQSSDGSGEIVKSYSDPRIRYFRAPAHTSLYQARNHAIERAVGDFIAFLDVDDWWSPTKLAEQIPLFSDSSVGMVAGNYWIENELKGSRHKANAKPVPAGWVLDDLLRSYYVGLLTLVVRRSALEGLEYACDPRFSIIGDFDLVIRLATRWKLAYVQHPVAHYRLHEHNYLRRYPSRHVEELDLWLGDPGLDAEILNSPGLAGFRAELEYSKAMNLVLDGRRWRALRVSRGIPVSRYKARFWAAIVLPRFVIRRLKN